MIEYVELSLIRMSDCPIRKLTCVGCEYLRHLDIRKRLDKDGVSVWWDVDILCAYPPIKEI